MEQSLPSQKPKEIHRVEGPQRERFPGADRCQEPGQAVLWLAQLLASFWGPGGPGNGR